MPVRPRTTRPPRHAGRIPLWIAALLLFVAVWLGARILHNVTEALTRIASGPPAASGGLTSPGRTMADPASR